MKAYSTHTDAYILLLLYIYILDILKQELDKVLTNHTNTRIITLIFV